MKRRTFFGNVLAAGAFGALAPDAAPAFQTSDTAAPDPEVKRVLVMFKCHLDEGFIDTQANVVRKYFEQHFPRAIQTAAALRTQGEDRYVWTTGSWLVYQYLEKRSMPERHFTSAFSITAGEQTTFNGSAKICGSASGFRREPLTVSFSVS